MDAKLEKLQKALETEKKASIRVGRNRISVYPSTRGGKASFTLCWHDGAGRQRKESINKEFILEEAARVYGALSSGHSLASRLDVSQVQRFAQADMALPGVSVEELVAFYKSHNQGVNGFAQVKVSALVAEYLLAAKANGRSQRHQQTLRYHLNNFAAAFPSSIGLIRSQQIDTYLYTITNPKTRINHRTSIVSLFRFARRKKYLPIDRPTEAEGAERPETPVSEPDILTPKNFDALLEACADKKLRTYLLIGGLAGIRSAEIQRIRWEDVRGDAIALGPKVTKSRRRRMVEVCERLQKELALLQGEPTDFVTYLSPSYLHLLLRDLAAKAGVVFPANCLRHSFVSYHLEFYRDPSRTSKTSGHSLQILESSYLKLVSRDAAALWFRAVLCSSANNLNRENA